MSTVIAHNGGTIVPLIVDGYEASSAPGTVVHTILGRPDPDITFRPIGLRAGVLTLVFASGADAAAAETALRVPQVLDLSDTDVPEVGMSFVIAGDDLRSTLDETTRKAWLLEVPFQEVAP